MASACLLCGRRARYRDTHGCLPRPLPEATRLSFSLCLWHLPSCCLSAVAHGECLGVRESVRRPFLRNSWVSHRFPSHSDRWTKSLFIFTSRFYGSSSSQPWCSSLWSPVWLFRGDLCSRDISPESHVDVGPGWFASPSFFPVSIWLLYILSYWSSVQIDFRLFSNLVVL